MTKRVRKFKVYNTLIAAFRRRQMDKPGILATLLLETFLENNGMLTARTVEKAGLCEADGFKAWREPLIKDGWLQYDYEYAKATRKGSLHQPGKLLIPYLNKEKMSHHSLVTETQLNRSLEPINERLDALENFMRGVIEGGVPPYTVEKAKTFLDNPQEFIKAMRSRLNEEETDEEETLGMMRLTN